LYGHKTPLSFPFSVPIFWACHPKTALPHTLSLGFWLSGFPLQVRLRRSFPLQSLTHFVSLSFSFRFSFLLPVSFFSALVVSAPKSFVCSIIVPSIIVPSIIVPSIIVPSIIVPPA
jgi:hypothetical protein